MLFLLLACHTPRPETGPPPDSTASEDTSGAGSGESAVETGESAEPDTAGDTAVDGDTETGTPVDTADPLGCAGEDVPSTPVCALANPGAVAPETFDVLRDVVFDEVFPHLYELGDDPGCPILTMDGTTEVWTGGCSTADGRTYGGTARLEQQVSGETATETFDHFTETAADHAYAIDGNRAITWVMEGSYEDVSLTISISGSDDPAVPDGDRTLAGGLGVVNLYETINVAMTVDGEDWCVHSARSWWYWDACDEVEGASVVVGARTATWVEQGYPECDGCVCFEPEDEDASLYCR